MPSLLYGQAEAGRHRWPHRSLRAPLRQAREKGRGLIDPEQRSRLLGAKLRALIAEGSAGPDDLELSTFPGGVAARAGSDAWFLADENPARALGPALAWAQQRHLDTLHVLADVQTGILARRAAEFAVPPNVWTVEGRRREPAEPAPSPQSLDAPQAALDHVGLLVDAGAEVVIEHGQVRGEILGLEVARVVIADDGTSRLEVGVGHHDREAFAMVHGDVPTPAALASVVDSVRRHRHTGAGSHPLARLAPERWMRSVLVADPSRLGLGHLGLEQLEFVEPTVPRVSLKDPAPAIAFGVGREGPVVLACSSGVDLDLVPAAADARRARAPDARLVLVVPARDALPATRRLAGSLRLPAELVAVETDWRA